MKEPIRRKLTDTPTPKEVKKIPLPPLNRDKYDLGMMDDVYSSTNYKTYWKTYTADEATNENNSENNSESIQQLESDETN